MGIFGLRKTGKTSLLHEIIRSHDSERGREGSSSVLVYQDLEYLPSLVEDPIPDLIQDLAENIRRRLKERGLRTKELADLPNPASPSDFRRALDSLLEKLDGAAKIVLLLDEIEYLCPPNPGPDTSSEGFQRVRQLLGGLRKLVQERDNFGFVIAGLANSVVESSHLYGAPNPLFSYARPMYLRPFSRDEAEGLLNTVGKRVSLHWSSEAVDLAYDLSGGHALLLRDLASAVLNDQKDARSNIVQVKPGHIQRVRPGWQQAVSSHVREVLPHLETYYKEEAELAILLIEEPFNFTEYALEYPDQVGRLEQLGIIRPLAAGGWEPSRLLEFSYAHHNKQTIRSRAGVVETLDPIRVAALAATEEGERLERKETLRSHGGKIPDEVIVDQTLKACLGLLNRIGGHVLVGIADDGAIVGLERDLKVCGNQDRLVRFLTDKIRDKIGNVGLDLIQISTHSISDKIILVLSVASAKDPVFPLKSIDGKGGLFVRNNNTTRLLVDRDAIEYTRRQWP